MATLLVVSSHQAYCTALRRCLRAAGYRVRTSASAKGAWRYLLAQGDASAMVCLDQASIGADSLDLLRQIKNHPRLAIVPVIIRMALGIPSDIVRDYVHSGADYCFSKACDHDVLLAMLASMPNFSPGASSPFLHWPGLLQLEQAQFSFRTLVQAQTTAYFIAQLCAKPNNAVLGLSELMINAIEHGNLGITYQQKKCLLQHGKWDAEIKKRLQAAEFKDKQVRVIVHRAAQTSPAMIVVEVHDEGHGFKWEDYLRFAPERSTDPNGRGIALAKMLSFTHLSYRGCGNIAVAQLMAARA